ncbi:MAG: hypothetical protein ACLQPH_10560 [Acidimicrobiales bacterium]
MTKPVQEVRALLKVQIDRLPMAELAALATNGRAALRAISRELRSLPHMELAQRHSLLMIPAGSDYRPPASSIDQVSLSLATRSPMAGLTTRQRFPVAQEPATAIQPNCLVIDQISRILVRGLSAHLHDLGKRFRAYSYLVAPCSPGLAAAAPGGSCEGPGGTSPFAPSLGAELGQFVDFMACAGQAKMATVGHAALPPNLVQDDFDAIGRMNGGVRPAPPTAANCPNPYVDGQTQLPS